jgi:hypothetical protein
VEYAQRLPRGDSHTERTLWTPSASSSVTTSYDWPGHEDDTEGLAGLAACANNGLQINPLDHGEYWHNLPTRR